VHNLVTKGITDLKHMEVFKRRVSLMF